MSQSARSLRDRHRRPPSGLPGLRAAVARGLAGALLLAAAAPPAGATQVKIFTTQSRAAFLAGTLEGISVDPLGRLELADRIDRLTAVGEPFLLAAAAHPEGWVVGTGNAGRVLLVDHRGQVRELFAAPEPEVFAVWADPDGTVFAGTSPEGKVYRIPAGGEAATAFFDPGETYVWALARDAEGALLVATGTQGKLYRVTGEGQGEVVYDSDDTHLRSLQVLPDGDVQVGTAGEGLILRLSAVGSGEPSVRTLYDAAMPEVVALTAAPDGTSFAALAASESSLVDLSRQPAPKEKKDDDAAAKVAEGEITIEASSGAEAPTLGSRRAGFKGARSEVVRIAAGGLVESLAELEEETVFSLLWHRGRLWVGTGLEGKLYSWDGPGAELVLEKDVDERQVVGLMADDPGPAFATTNSAALYRVTGGSEREGTYTSAAVDAAQIARFGNFRWRGTVPRKGELTFSFRSGMSAEPDRTWSPWSEARGGDEITLGDLPLGRYAQWRGHFRAGDGESPVLYGVELSYLQENLSPKIERFQVLDPGEILVPANFNPSNQVFEPAHPNRDGIFTTLEPAEDANGRLKTLWKQGYRTLRWKVEDPNDDHLRFHLDFRPEGTEEWLEMARALEDDHYSFDATVLPDGVYRFRLRASDEPHNHAGTVRVAEQVSQPVTIDHAAPRLESVVRDGGVIEARVADALSPLREATVSFDAGEWRPVEVADGLLDGRRETLRIDLGKAEEEGGEEGGVRLVLLRLTDASHNVVTLDLTGSLP